MLLWAYVPAAGVILGDLSSSARVLLENNTAVNNALRSRNTA